MYGLIYCAQNMVNGKRYVGKTMRGLEKRVKEHNQDATKNDRQHIYLYRAFHKYGFTNFSWTILCYCSDNQGLVIAEQYWIRILQTSNKQYGYNLTIGGDGTPGWKHSVKVKCQISAAQKQAWANPERKMKRLSVQRAPISEEGRKRMSMGARKRRASEETKAKISEATKGINNPMYGRRHTEESRHKMRLSTLGQICTGTTRNKLSVTSKQRWTDPIMRDRIIAAQKRAWEDRRVRNDNR